MIMKELFTQIRDSCPICKGNFGLFYLPFQDADREISKEFKLFQVVRAKIFGFKKERSLKQLGTYWSACQFITDSTENKQWNTKEKVDFRCRVGTHFVDPDLVVVKPDGAVQFSYRSIAFKNLGHIEATNYFSRAYDIMVDFWNATHKKTIGQEELIEMVKQSMRQNNVGG